MTALFFRCALSVIVISMLLGSVRTGVRWVLMRLLWRVI
jgi:hypothetical protein